MVLVKICHKISVRTRELIKKHEEIAEKTAHIEAEFSVAEKIQKYT